MKLARARAALQGRDYVLPDDVKQVAVPALAHRLILSPELWAREVRPEKVVEEVLGRVPVPKVGQVEGRRKALWELVLLVLLLGAGLFLRRRELLLLSIPLAVHLVVGLALAPPQWRPRLQVSRSLSATRLVEGEELEVTLTVENRGRLLDRMAGGSPLSGGAGGAPTVGATAKAVGPGPVGDQCRVLPAYLSPRPVLSGRLPDCACLAPPSRGRRLDRPSPRPRVRGAGDSAGTR